jgi:flagellar hook-associated protein 2
MKKLIDSYNELTKIIDEETYGKDKVIEDMSSFKMMMSGIKEKLFRGYGENHDLNLFSFGVSLNKDGSLTLNEDTFKKAISDNRDDLESLFLGVAENKGLGTQIKEYLDDLNGYNGIMTKFDEKLKEDKTELEKDKEEAEKALKNKYKQMALQFAAYGTIIAQMEAAFGGMKMMIQQSVKG